MTVAADLLEAANLAPQNIRALWVADTLQTQLDLFWQALQPEFEEQTPNDRPVGDWIAIIASFTPSILPYADNTAGAITQVSLAYDYVYRLCKFAYYYTLISGAQQTAILDAYNTYLA